MIELLQGRRRKKGEDNDENSIDTKDGVPLYVRQRQSEYFKWIGAAQRHSTRCTECIERRGRRDEAKERHVWSTPRYHGRANNPVELKRTNSESSYEIAAAVHLCSVTRDAFALRNCLRRLAACSFYVTGLSFTTCGAAHRVSILRFSNASLFHTHR